MLTLLLGVFITTDLVMADFDGVTYTMRTPGAKQTLEQQTADDEGAEGK